MHISVNRNQSRQETAKAAYQLPAGKNPTYSGEVWVFAEQEGGEINEASYELLGKARELATQVNAKVGAVLVGQNNPKLPRVDLIWSRQSLHDSK